MFKTCREAQFISNSPYIQENVLKRWGMDTPIVPNAVNSAFIHEPRQYPKSNSPVIVSIAQRPDPWKNIEKLLEAFKIIQQRFPDAKLKLIGGGFVSDSTFYSEMKSRNLTDNVEFSGHYKTEELVEELKHAHLMIHPSLEESFGISFIEAMASGLPVIGGDSSGAVPWVLNYGKAGTLCDVTNAVDIAEKSIELLCSKDKWECFSREGFQHVIDNFTVESVAEQTLAIYEQKRLSNSRQEV